MTTQKEVFHNGVCLVTAGCWPNQVDPAPVLLGTQIDVRSAQTLSVEPSKIATSRHLTAPNTLITAKTFDLVGWLVERDASGVRSGGLRSQTLGSFNLGLESERHNVGHQLKCRVSTQELNFSV